MTLAANNIALVPFVQPSTESFFVPEHLVPTRTEVIEGIEVPTRPLVFGKNISLLGISMHPELLMQGSIDQTDSIDPQVRLSGVWLHLPAMDEVVKITISPLGAPEDAPSGLFSDRRDIALIGSWTLHAGETMDGSQLELPGIVMAELQVTGSIYLETGEVQLQVVTSAFHFDKGDEKELNLFLNGATYLGYELSAKRANHNRRPR